MLARTRERECACAAPLPARLSLAHAPPLTRHRGGAERTASCICIPADTPLLLYATLNTTNENKQTQGPAGTKLYEYTRAASGASGWALLASRATPRFYDANGGSDGDDRSDDDEGGRRAPRDWHLEASG